MQIWEQMKKGRSTRRKWKFKKKEWSISVLTPRTRPVCSSAKLNLRQGSGWSSKEQLYPYQGVCKACSLASSDPGELLWFLRLSNHDLNSGMRNGSSSTKTPMCCGFPSCKDPLHGSQPCPVERTCITQWSYEPFSAGAPIMDGS